MKTLRHAFEIKFASHDDTGVLEGYGSVYGNIDQAGDIIAHGAFAKSISDKKQGNKKFPFLYQHATDDPIGVIDSISEDNNGLLIRVKLNLDVQRAREALALIKQGAITGLSVGFITMKDEIDGRGVRIIKEAKLMEVSAVTFPCNELAQITSVKSETITFIEDSMNNEQIAIGITKLNTLKQSADRGNLDRKSFEATLSETISLLEKLGAATKGAEVEPQTPGDGEPDEALVMTEAESPSTEPLAATEIEDPSIEDEINEDELKALMHSLEMTMKAI